MIEKFYDLLTKIGIVKAQDKVLHFTIIFLAGVVGIPLLAVISVYTQHTLPYADREIVLITYIVVSQFVIFGKEHLDGWTKDWFFDVIAGELGMFFGVVVGGSIAALIFI